MSAAQVEAEKAYTFIEAAAIKSVSVDTIRRAYRSGALRAKRIGKGYRVRAGELDRWFNEEVEDA